MIERNERSRNKRIVHRQRRGIETMREEAETQVLIIGAGLTGLMVARELSKYKVDVTVVDKNEDVGMGQTRASHGHIYGEGLSWANSLILKSVMLPPGAPLYNPDCRKLKMEAEGFKDMPRIFDELDVPSESQRRVAIAFDEDQVKNLKIAANVSRQGGVELTWLNRDEVLHLEPNVNKNVVAGLLDEGHRISLYPWDLAIALAENLKENGVRIMLSTQVIGIKPLEGGFAVDTINGHIRTEFIINAAGHYGTKIADMAGVRDFDLKYNYSQMLVLDKRLAGLIKGTVSLAPTPGKFSTLNPTLSGNIHIACSRYVPTQDTEKSSTSSQLTDESIESARELVPSISVRDVIASYIGIRVFTVQDPEEDLLEVSERNSHFINAIARLPGIVVLPPASRYILELLSDQGLVLTMRTDFNPFRKAIPRVNKLPDEERQELIARDPRYGRIVCRCEEVSEGEIVEAIRRGARTMMGIKYRTRAGMGRCQRGFCGPRVVKILARELDIPMTEVTQKGGLSRVLLHRGKELLGQGGLG